MLADIGLLAGEIVRSEMKSALLYFWLKGFV